MGYTKDAISSFSWMATLRGATRAITFLRTILLAKFLSPAQFGAYGVALLVVGFLEVITETGVNIILIQEKEINKYIDSAWIVSIIRGTIIALVIVLFTPLIVNFFHSPESAMLLYGISLVPFLRGFINPSVVNFQKELHFNQEFWYRFAILVIDSSVSVVATVLTGSPIGIVMGLLAGVTVEVVLSHFIVKPTPVFRFQRAYINIIIKRGRWVTVGSIFNYLFHNADNIVVGRLLGTSALGTYQIAYAFAILPITELTDILSKVTFPIFTKIADDKIRLKKAFYKMLGILTLLSLPCGLLLSMYPKEIILLTVGDKWLIASSILPILAVFGVIRAISSYSITLFYATQKQEYTSVVTLVSTLGLLLPIIPLVSQMGITGAAIAALIGSLVAVPLYIFFCTKILR